MQFPQMYGCAGQKSPDILQITAEAVMPLQKADRQAASLRMDRSPERLLRIQQRKITGSTPFSVTALPIEMNHSVRRRGPLGSSDL